MQMSGVDYIHNYNVWNYILNVSEHGFECICGFKLREISWNIEDIDLVTNLFFLFRLLERRRNCTMQHFFKFKIYGLFLI